jgi:hypothetical protein
MTQLIYILKSIQMMIFIFYLFILYALAESNHSLQSIRLQKVIGKTFLYYLCTSYRRLNFILMKGVKFSFKTVSLAQCLLLIQEYLFFDEIFNRNEFSLLFSLHSFHSNFSRSLNFQINSLFHLSLS